MLALPPVSNAFSLITLRSTLPPRNVEVVPAAKVCKYQALDPKHELSEAKDTFKDIFKNEHNNNNNGIDAMKLRHPSLRIIQAGDCRDFLKENCLVMCSFFFLCSSMELFPVELL